MFLITVFIVLTFSPIKKLHNFISKYYNTDFYYILCEQKYIIKYNTIT